MAVSKESVICPYCKHEHSKNKAIGTSGIVNYYGSELTVTCDICKKNFHVEYEVQFKFRTSKE